MKLKYENELVQMIDCPPRSCTARKLLAYRFVFLNWEHPNNFSPVAYINPRRKFKNDGDKCKSYGLSLYDTPEKARRMYGSLLKSIPKAVTKIGTHIAKGEIDERDGVASAPSENGHFTLYESKDCDLKIKFFLYGEAN